MNYPKRLIKRGSKGKAVRWVQDGLRVHGHKVDLDGHFGPKTEGAVRAFQKAHGLDADGVVGPRTWGALSKAPGHTKPTAWKPRIIRLELDIQNKFGALGPETKATTHYAASPRAKNLDRALRLALLYHRFHKAKGWGGLAYHFLIPDSGELLLGRPVHMKGTHVGGLNSGNVGVNFFAGPGHKPTQEQIRTARWLQANAHTEALPKSHRTDRDLREAEWRGHRSWPKQFTGCPGFFTPRNLKLR